MVVGIVGIATGATGPEDKEVLRHQAQRQRENERLKKLGPGRLRFIGADIAGLKNQVDEKQQQDAVEKEAQRQDDDENEAIRRYLLQVESEDALAKRQEVLTLRNDWQYQMGQRDDEKQQYAAFKAIGIDPDTCAPGAAQKFDGEDVLRAERLRLQALQSKQWSQQLAEERRQREATEQQDEAAYMAYLFDIERLQQQLHTANERERASIAIEIQRMNQLAIAAKRDLERQQQQRDQAADAQEIQYQLASNLVSENPQQAALPGGVQHRVRVDHWKGLSSDQTRGYLRQNDELLADKAAQRAHERHVRDDDAQREREFQRILAADELLSQRKRAQIEMDMRLEREQQIRDAKAREKRNDDAARGAFEPSFFQQFGRSYR